MIPYRSSHRLLYAVNFILNTVAQFAKSLVLGIRVWFVIPS